jgi:oxepin-CoA hydrolase / 3-oxo-5,6-dehydrosuberyl-CoA semialdehyde dehydrogenase
MNLTSNYALAQWHAPQGDLVPQFHAVSGKEISIAGDFTDFAPLFDHARKVGGKALRSLTFYQRGLMLKHLALYLTERKPHYYAVSYQTGATKTDSWIDIDGGIGNLFAYASLRRQLGNETFYVDGEAAKISKGGSFIGLHLCVPKTGVAVHINAFNFPVWGMLEKCAVNWLAGMPAIVKASEATSFLTRAVVEDIVNSGILPEGALQFIGGKGHGLLNFIETQDVVTFTGSAKTGKNLRALPQFSEKSVAFNLEADSLNAMILGEDCTPETPEFDIFIKNVRSEMVIKTGQKCTAVRRIIVPADLLEAAQKALTKELSKTVLGDPNAEGVRMGALVNRVQVERVRAQVDILAQQSPLVFGDLDNFDVVGADRLKGAFLPPILMRNDRPFEFTAVHEIEAFGPVATLMPYEGIEEAIALANMGKGSLVSTICTFDARIAREFVLSAG